MEKLGKIEEVPLRDIWKSEPRNFTKWLSQKENLNLLGEKIGLELEIETTEAEVGNFYIDILAKDGNGDYVIIENQLEATDHKHLGQIITYASGKEAKTIVWIAKDFRDEFKKAIEWLNEHTDDNINFFAIEIELLKIGDSLPAPNFIIIEQPNEWAKVIKKENNKGTSETELKRLEFWTDLKEYAKENNISIFTHKPSKNHWYNITVGKAGVCISLSISFHNNMLTCSFLIDDDKELFDNLFSYKENIEKELGYSVKWDRKSDNTKASSVTIEKKFVFENEDKIIAFKWLTDKTIEFRNIFTKYLQKTDI